MTMLVEFLRAVIPLGVIALALVSPFVWAALPTNFVRLFEDFVKLADLYPERSPRQERRGPPLWKTILLVGMAAVESTVWLGVFGNQIVSGGLWYTSFLISLGWLYALIAPLVFPSPLPSKALISLYLVHFILSAITLTLVAYAQAEVWPHQPPPLPPTPTLVLEVFNGVICLALFGVQLSLPTQLLPPELEALNKAEIESGKGSGTSPEDWTSLYGWITFIWFNPLIKKGSSGSTLAESQVWSLSPTMQSGPCFRAWKAIQSGTLLRKLGWANSWDLLGDISLCIVSVGLNYLSPFCIKQIIDALDQPSSPKLATAYIFAVIALFSTILKAESDLNHLWFSRRASVRAKSTLTSAIYEKALKRKDFSGVSASSDDEKKSSGAAGTGKIVNLMAGDTNRIGNTFSGLYMLYSAPFEIVICCSFLYSLLGWSAFAGLLPIFAAMPINTYISKRNVVIQKDLLSARDKRLNVMNELISSIRYIKFFSWEKNWSQKAIDARRVELRVMVRDRINSVFFNLLWLVTPLTVTIIAFFCFIKIQGGELTVGTAFTALSLFSMLRQPLNVIPMFIVSILQTLVAIGRIEEFLNEDEVPTYVSTLKLSEASPSVSSPTEIGFVGASFKWPSDTPSLGAEKNDKKAVKKPWWKVWKKDENAGPHLSLEEAVTGILPEQEEVTFELSDVSFIFPPGKLTMILGPTGSGKTALLLALLGEMDLVKGSVSIPKNNRTLDQFGYSSSVAYTAQSPWLLNDTIRDNILFGTQYEEIRYDQVIEACALKPDLAQFEDGDQTEIGSKGVSLSGGQKARVSLARALYSRAKNVLIDDCLAAVDAHTSAYLVEHALSGPLVANRTVIIVSHHVELLLPVAHSLIRILDGRVDIKGSLEDLRANGSLSSIIITEESEVTNVEEPLLPDTPIVEKKEQELLGEDEEADESGEGSATEVASSDEVNKADKDKTPKKLIKDEEREVGNVKFSTYQTYLKSTSYAIWGVTLCLMLFSQNMALAERWWIRVWTNSYSDRYHPPGTSFTGFVSAQTIGDSAHHHLSQTAFFTEAVSPMFNLTAVKRPKAEEHPLYYLGIYALISLSGALLGIIQVVIGYVGAYRASKLLHNKMLKSVVQSPIRWFDVTPSGRIVNRFSRDLETVDSSLTQSLRVCAAWSASLIGAILMVAFVVPSFLIPAAFVFWAYFYLGRNYIRIGRDLRRIEAVARSPIFSGFSELLEGIVSVRAFGAENRFLNKLQNQVDKSHAAFYMQWMDNRHLLFRFDILGGCSVFLTSVLCLSGSVPSTYTGMAILSSQSFVNAIYWLCRFWSQLEMDLNSVERVQEYLDLDQEPQGGAEPPAYWPSSSLPSQGQPDKAMISVRNLEIRYAEDLPSVLHKVSFDVRPQEKIGLIGRTGSGKSTLGQALLRFVDPTSGTIIIDGLDITKISLQSLRSRLTLIPQDAVLFSGTIRDNLDPFNEHTDEELLDSLQRVQLGLDTSNNVSRAASSTNLEDVGSGAATPTSSKVMITLDSSVSAAGANFSQGQRQLIAIARALLRKNNIIIMDEATASVDFATDELIQTTIREQFKDSVVLTVAHRLSSIIDYDRLLVLDKGDLVEYDTPYNLLKMEGGVFKGMCEKSGKFYELLAAAEQKHEKDMASMSS